MVKTTGKRPTVIFSLRYSCRARVFCLGHVISASYVHQNLEFWCPEVEHSLVGKIFSLPFLLRENDDFAPGRRLRASSWVVWWCSITTLLNYDFTQDPYLGLVKSYWTYLVYACRAVHETAKSPFSRWQNFLSVLVLYIIVILESLAAIQPL